MAAPLIWDFYRTVGPADLGGVVHYYDETSQGLYLDDGLVTRLADIPEGHWEEATPADPQTITETAYTALRTDHPVNGILHMATLIGNTLAYLRYVYAMDISHITESGTYSMTNDNGIESIALDVQNVSKPLFKADSSLFQPGAKLELSIALGDSAPYPIGVAHVDDVDYKVTNKFVPINGRNKTGYMLRDSTFDDVTTFTGTATENIGAILTHAGITDFVVQTFTHEWTFTFDPDTKILDGLQTIFDWYAGLKLVELPDGKIVVGYPDWINTNYRATGYYQFNGGSEVFLHQNRKTSDVSYSKVYVTGKDSAEVELTPVVLPVPNFAFWALPAHKTYHMRAPDGKTQSELADFAADIVDRLQYVGITETFDGPLRPQLLIGDVAQIYSTGDTVATSLGTLTNIKHTFGKQGFATQFTLDSGGDVTDTESEVVAKNKRLGGYTRRQNIVDFIHNIAKGM